jgi:hypothetical protein
METRELIGELKQGSISVNKPKTMVRVKELWSSLSNAKKRQLMEDGDFRRPTLHRAYQTGSISAKLVVALAQDLDVDPLYITGETDEHGHFSNLKLIQLLNNHKYSHLAKLIESSPLSDGNDFVVTLAQLSTDDIIDLVKAFLIKAKLSGDYTEQLHRLKQVIL